MASGDTKTEALLNILGNGGSYEGISGCGNTKTQDYIIDAIDRIQTVEDEVEELKNNPDVFDIVDTYADLQNYDTSTITDKDIIRVLQDENHDGASTYYRWKASTSSFDYIGEVGDYYTKAQTDALLDTKADKATTYTKTEVDTALATKQDKLVAGDNIIIAQDGKTISADGLTVLSYGASWNDFITAYNAGKIVYCKASSNANPATGTQTRMAFMAYINNPTTPTSVEFQYVRSVSSKTAAQQCDQVFIYKLTNANGGTWSVETRDMASEIVAGTNMTSSYSNGTLTLNASGGGGSSDTATFYMSVTPFANNSGVSLYSDIALTTAVPASTFVQALRDCKSVFLVYKRGDLAWDERAIVQIVGSHVPNADTAEAYDEVFPAAYYFEGPTGVRHMIQSATSDPDDTASFTIHKYA